MIHVGQVAVVTGADRGLGLGIVQALLERGWTVFAGKHLDWPQLEELRQSQKKLILVSLDVSSDESVTMAAGEIAKQTDHIDLLIANAGLNRSHQIQTIRSELDFDAMLAETNVNAIGALRVVRAFLPLLDAGSEKRLCFVSSEAGSIGASKRTGWFGYCMSKAALNMAVKNLHNDLAPQGYRFRLYHPGWLRTYMSGSKNLEAQMEPEEGADHALRYFLDSNEPESLTLRDWQGNDYPW